MKTMILGIAVGLTFGAMRVAGAADATGAAQTQAPITLQTVCPVMGGKINKDLYVDYEGKRIYVCCQACIGPLKKDPAKCVEAMEKAGVALKFTPGTAGSK